jgi:hypothetical protein
MSTLKLFLIVAITTLFTGCFKPDPEREKANAEATVRHFYDAAENFDYERMRTFCTANFHVIEAGQTFKSLDEFTEMFKFLEGTKAKHNIEFVQTDIDRNHAFLIARFDAAFVKENARWDFKTIENYILKKIDGKWFIDFFHSTHLPDAHDKKLTSIHLLKIPDELSFSVLNDELQKVNAVIAGFGYPDCGYIIRSISPVDASGYNYLMQGNWKNPEIYNIIHEREEYKKSSEEAIKLLNYPKDRIYLRAMLP